MRLTGPGAGSCRRPATGLTWPKEYGGGGTPYAYLAIFLEKLARAEAPQHVGLIGLGMAGSTIISHGTQEQKRYLRPILTAEEIWCQGLRDRDAKYPAAFDAVFGSEGLKIIRLPYRYIVRMPSPSVGWEASAGRRWTTS